MTIGSILLSVSLFILVVGYLARPFFTPEEQPAQKSSRLDLLAQKDSILREIQKLDFEFETGTLPEPDYRQQRYLMIKEAALILQTFERSLPQQARLSDSIDAQIEAAIAQIRGVDPVNIQTTCPACDAPTKQGDKFCANCGHNLQEGSAA